MPGRLTAIVNDFTTTDVHQKHEVLTLRLDQPSYEVVAVK